MKWWMHITAYNGTKNYNEEHFYDRLFLSKFNFSWSRFWSDQKTKYARAPARDTLHAAIAWFISHNFPDKTVYNKMT